MITQLHISLSDLHRHRLPSYVSQFPLSSGVLVSDFRHFDPLHTHNRIQRIKYLSDVLRHLIRLSHGSVCCRITVSFMVHPHHSNLAFVRTTGNTADTFAPHRRSFGTRRLFHQTRSVQPAVSSVFCFRHSSSRSFHERLNHGFFPASFVLSTAVCVHCNISEFFTLRAITHSLIVVSACVTRSVVIHPISPPAISSTATILPEISRHTCSRYVHLLNSGNGFVPDVLLLPFRSETSCSNTQLV